MLPHGSTRIQDTRNDQSAAFADADFSDDDFDLVAGLESDDDDLDSVAGFDSLALAVFDHESIDDAVLPLVAGAAGVAAESDSVLPGVLFFA